MSAVSGNECKWAPRSKSNSKEIKYIKDCRNKLGGFTPSRVVSNKRMNPPNIEIFQELLDGTGEREAIGIRGSLIFGGAVVGCGIALIVFMLSI